LGEARRMILHEGHRWRIKTFDGNTDQGSLRKASGEVRISKQDIIRDGPAAFRKPFEEIASSIIGQQHKVLFEKLDEVTTATGNVVSQPGPLTPELLLEALGKIAIDFDGQGRPVMPTLVLHPIAWASIKDQLPKWEADPGIRVRFQDL